MVADSPMFLQARPVRLPLHMARVCLDCDVLTDSSICPNCARERTLLISRWLRPLNGSARGGAEVKRERRRGERRPTGARPGMSPEHPRTPP